MAPLFVIPPPPIVTVYVVPTVYVTEFDSKNPPAPPAPVPAEDGPPPAPPPPITRASNSFGVTLLT